MIRFLYALGVWLYYWAIGVAAALGSLKARLRWAGQRNPAPAPPPGRPVVWFHCSSLGEFEQGRPLLEALRAHCPSAYIALTFFSPSGYTVRHNYPLADWVGYLPADVGSRAQVFVNRLKPSLVVWVKYDLWWGFLEAVQAAGGHNVLIASDLVQSKWYKHLVLKQLAPLLKRVCVQQAPSAAAWAALGVSMPPVVAGDPRYDRVLALAAAAEPLPALEAWLGQGRCLVAGSTWPPDAAVLAEAAQQAPAGWRWVIVPHTVDEASVAVHLRHFSQAVRWSALRGGPVPPEAQVLLVDTVGLLGRLYRYGHLMYVGGGYNHGIHNTLEAAVWGRPVLFGPRYQRFHEARALLVAGAADAPADAAVITAWLQRASVEDDRYRAACQAARAVTEAGGGATDRIVNALRQQGLWPC
ncbi:MAG: glycosyltransferase N-terminal domain-containing protein [Bacteroidia bacterium]|nr:glycosyltransferase N-terminal domain-containing protein [Bacteroidia bacterium]